MPETLAERIHRLRLQRGITHRALGARIGVDWKNVWRWETGERMPHAGTLPNLANALGVSTDYLLTGRETPHHAALLAAVRRAGERGTRDPILAAMLRYAP